MTVWRHGVDGFTPLSVLVREIEAFPENLGTLHTFSAGATPIGATPPTVPRNRTEAPLEHWKEPHSRPAAGRQQYPGFSENQ
jgi:hypothetical protein